MSEAWKEPHSSSWSIWPGRAEDCCCGHVRCCHPTSPADWMAAHTHPFSHGVPPCFFKVGPNRNMLSVSAKLKLPSDNSMILWFHNLWTLKPTPKLCLVSISVSHLKGVNGRETSGLYVIPNTANKVLPKSTIPAYAAEFQAHPLIQYETRTVCGLTKKALGKAEGFWQLIQFYLNLEEKEIFWKSSFGHWREFQLN